MWRVMRVSILRVISAVIERQREAATESPRRPGMRRVNDRSRIFDVAVAGITITTPLLRFINLTFDGRF